MSFHVQDCAIIFREVAANNSDSFFDNKVADCGTTIALLGRAIGVATKVASPTRLSLALTAVPTPLVVVVEGTGDLVVAGNPEPALSSTHSLHNSISARHSQGIAAAGALYHGRIKMPSSFPITLALLCCTQELRHTRAWCRRMQSAQIYKNNYINPSITQCACSTAACFVCMLSCVGNLARGAWWQRM